MKIYIILLLGICWLHTVQSEFTLPPFSQNFNCHKDVPRHPLILKNVAGVWYEIGRVPKTDAFQCLNVTVPDTADSELVLDLEYIRTYDGSRTPVKESLSFPWNTNTQNSIFNLYYGAPSRLPAITYKLMLMYFIVIMPLRLELMHANPDYIQHTRHWTPHCINTMRQDMT
ncbi:hypothetical protein ACLKA7_008303 [Drosophila subpalustris]